MLNKNRPYIAGLSAAILLGLMTSVAHAQAPGLYLGGSWGAYSVESSDLDENDNVLKTVVGGQFNDWFALEGGWTDFDRTDSGSNRFDADGKGLAAVFLVPIGVSSSLFVKAGQFWWDANSNLGDSSGNDLFGGIGVKFGFGNNFAFRLEAERYDIASSDLDTFTAGLEFKFN